MKTVKYIRVALSVAILAMLVVLIALGYREDASHYMLTVDVTLFSTGACIIPKAMESMGSCMSLVAQPDMA